MSISDYSRGDLIQVGLSSLVWEADTELPLVLQESRCHNQTYNQRYCKGGLGRRNGINWLVV